MKNEGKIKEYIQNAFGWKVDFENFDSYKGMLPYILLGAAEYSLIMCDGYKGVAIQPKEEDDFRMTKNIVQNIERITGLKSIIKAGGYSAWQVKSEDKPETPVIQHLNSKHSFSTKISNL